MDESHRSSIYGFLSRVFSNTLDLYALEEIKKSELLETIGESSKAWFFENELSLIQDELNTDFTSLFLMNNHPIESSIMDNKAEVQIGLSNPVTLFYHSNGYNINLGATHINTPDHIAIEFGFMEYLINEKDLITQKKFLKNHLGSWAPAFLIACKNEAKTPFFRDLCDFTAEFIIADYNNINN